MIQERTMLNVVDNSGAHRTMCIKVLDGLHHCYAGVDDTIKIITKKAIPCGKVRKGDVPKAVVVRTKKGACRSDGSIVRLDGNACVLLSNNSEQPIDTCILGSVARKLHSEEFMKIISLAPEVF